jgi:hypothetical protein
MLVATYRIAHLGISNGLVSGLKRPKMWTGYALQRLARMCNGATVKIGHDRNDPSIGTIQKAHLGPRGVAITEVVADVLIYAYAGGAIRRIKNGELDICSIEADLVVQPYNGFWLVEEVEKVTALALASSAEKTPGFPYATLMGIREEDD